MNEKKLADLVSLQRTLYSSSNPTRRWLHTHRRDRIFESLRTAPVPRWKHALEVGPGSGVYLPLLCEHFEFVTAIDVEPSHMNELRKSFCNFSNLHLIEGDVCRYRSLSRFDVVLCSEVIEHVPDPGTFMAALAKAIGPQGILILSTPQPWSVMEVAASLALSPVCIPLTRWIYGEPVLPTGHISVQSSKKLRDLLRRNGLELLKSEFFGLYLPLVAEFGGKHGASLLKRLDRLVDLHGPRSMLWTQLHVARKSPVRGESRADI